MADKVVVSRRTLNAVMASRGIRGGLPCPLVVLVGYDDIYRLAAKVVAKRHGVRKIYRFREGKPVFSHRNLFRLSGGLLSSHFCVAHRLAQKTAEEVAAEPALERLSPEHREEVRRRLAEFSTEVESLASSLWEALSQESVSLPPSPRGWREEIRQALAAANRALYNPETPDGIKKTLLEVVFKLGPLSIG